MYKDYILIEGPWVECPCNDFFCYLTHVLSFQFYWQQLIVWLDQVSEIGICFWKELLVSVLEILKLDMFALFNG